MGRVSSTSIAKAEKVSWYGALFMAVMLLLMSCCKEEQASEREAVLRQWNKACDEIYVVREGETLHTIGEKCGDPFIVEQNPHIHDPDDVFPGLVLKITPFNK
ncbi:transcription initiation factor TFIID subunit 12-like isoform X1 [Hibiscus syriacus]|uniref:Transcription initiation factor TFIID subunit 12-like isoform X1 n=1 Tax=Hibiscus syriacus TaxID=106335 RepID=A0A6A2X145_HIBSY|nr:uncharacterized protein LOC120177838 [Hibiscus syriacus]KAE8668423.1 transcription initiation factor TFIID subunit 12-like isoform X1 [Hibiscus syriacus]